MVSGVMPNYAIVNRSRICTARCGSLQHSATDAIGGPCRNHSSNLIDSVYHAPHARTSTSPSGKLIACPVSCSSAAISLVLARKNTPCTRPLTLNWRHTTWFADARGAGNVSVDRRLRHLPREPAHPEPCLWRAMHPGAQDE